MLGLINDNNNADSYVWRWSAVAIKPRVNMDQLNEQASSQQFGDVSNKIMIILRTERALSQVSSRRLQRHTRDLNNHNNNNHLELNAGKKMFFHFCR